MNCKVTFVESGVYVHDKQLWGQYKWTRLLDVLGRSKKLHDLVLKRVIRDIRRGRKPLIISDRRMFASNLAKSIKASGYNPKLLMGGEQKSSKSDLSNPWKPIIEGLESRNIHAVVGTGVMNEGVNIPPLDTLHLPFPSANPPQEEQRAGRIRRFWPGKRTPKIYVYTHSGADIAVHGSTRTRIKVYENLGFEFTTAQTEQPKPQRRRL
jgi:superfamily II DNA or RNA helicase